MKINKLTLAVALVFASQAHAAVPASVPAFAVGDAQEAIAPFVLAPGYTQKVIATRTNQLALGQSNSGAWDMIDTNRTGADAGRYLFMPYETGTGGVQRVDLWDNNFNTRTVTIVASGTQGFVAGDASRWTPWGTYLTAEESWSDPAQTASKYGRLFEITNPTAAVADINFVHRKIGPADMRVSHEGLAFDKNNNFYFIDERDNSGIFKFTSTNPNATDGATFFGSGQTSVLRVGNGFNNDYTNVNEEVTGAYSWIALTNATGTPLSNAIVKTDPNGLSILDGRATPNVIGLHGTNFDRPEDLEIKTLANGDQILYVATTTNDKVFALELATNNIDLFASTATAGAGADFNNPDNMAIDAYGNMYIIEDQPGGVANIWKATDVDNDGDAESIDVWATLQTAGAEPTGLFYNDFNGKFYVNVQHPSSGNDVLVEISAVPEPETYAMMLAGLGLVGFMAHRRKQK
jgi:hypothetical protein